MSEENKAILNRLYEMFSQGNVTGLDELMAAGFIDHNPDPNQGPGLEGLKQALTMWRSAFPDLRMSAEDLIAEDDKVVSRVLIQGTNSGAFMGMPATGKQVTITGIEIVRIADGKIVERWGELDAMGMLQQLGAVPPPG